MSSKNKSTVVYDNNHCKVIVRIRPDKKEWYYGPDPKYGSYFLYAEVLVTAADRKNYISRSIVFPWNKVDTHQTGRLWWKKTVIIKETSPSDQLEQFTIEAIKFADKHLYQYQSDTQEASEILGNIEHVIQARQQIHELEEAPFEVLPV